MSHFFLHSFYNKFMLSQFTSDRPKVAKQGPGGDQFKELITVAFLLLPFQREMWEKRFGFSKC